MHRRQWLQLPAAALLGATARAARGQAAPADGDPAIDRLLAARVRVQGVGLVGAVVDVDRVRVGAAGTRRAGTDLVPTADTLVEYGSITKTFTALLLADAVLRRELALADPVEAVLPDGLTLRDRAGSPLTWADLATHRSGLPRLPGNLRDPTGADPYDYSRTELWTFVRGWKPERARDEQWAYSNLGYGLLAEALALRAGRSYAALLDERVLRPLGLAGMSLALRDGPVAGLLPGHDASGRPVPNWRFDALAGAGALVGSVRALARYAQAALGLFDHPLREAFRLALTPRAEGPSAHNPVGLAWLFGPLNGRRVANHDGATGGFSTSLFLDPERRRAALVLAHAQVGINDLALHLLDPAVPLRDLSAEQRQRERAAASVPAEQLRPLAGSYALNAQLRIHVRERDGRLFAQATGQGEFELFAIDARRFFARVAALEMHFDGDRGVPASLRLHQAGQTLRFVRE